MEGLDGCGEGGTLKLEFLSQHPEIIEILHSAVRHAQLHDGFEFLSNYTVNRLPSVQRVRSDGIGALPHCETTHGSQRAAAEGSSGCLRHHDEAALENSRRAVSNGGGG